MSNETKNKPVSCGVVITDGDVLLLGHSTNNEHWDIPKGKMNDDETYLQAALRELHEETSILLTVDDVTEIGVLDYTPRKNLYLCYYKSVELPQISNIICTSCFIQDDKEYLELDRFKYIKFEHIGYYTTTNMLCTLQKQFDIFR